MTPKLGPNAKPTLALLLRSLRGLPTRLREVGRCLPDHEFDATTRSMRGWATSAGINPANFTRLAQAMGYTGWEAQRRHDRDAANRGSGPVPAPCPPALPSNRVRPGHDRGRSDGG